MSQCSAFDNVLRHPALHSDVLACDGWPFEATIQCQHSGTTPDPEEDIEANTDTRTCAIAWAIAVAAALEVEDACPGPMNMLHSVYAAVSVCTCIIRQSHQFGVNGITT